MTAARYAGVNAAARLAVACPFCVMSTTSRRPSRLARQSSNGTINDVVLFSVPPPMKG